MEKWWRDSWLWKWLSELADDTDMENNETRDCATDIIWWVTIVIGFFFFISLLCIANYAYL